MVKDSSKVLSNSGERGEDLTRLTSNRWAWPIMGQSATMKSARIFFPCCTTGFFFGTHLFLLFEDNPNCGRDTVSEISEGSSSISGGTLEVVWVASVSGGTLEVVGVASVSDGGLEVIWVASVSDGTLEVVWVASVSDSRLEVVGVGSVSDGTLEVFGVGSVSGDTSVGAEGGISWETSECVLRGVSDFISEGNVTGFSEVFSISSLVDMEVTFSTTSSSLSSAVLPICFFTLLFFSFLEGETNFTASLFLGGSLMEPVWRYFLNLMRVFFCDFDSVKFGVSHDIAYSGQHILSFCGL